MSGRIGNPPPLDAPRRVTSELCCSPTSNRQNDAELCVGAHHARVSLGPSSPIIAKSDFDVFSESDFPRKADRRHRNEERPIVSRMQAAGATADSGLGTGSCA